MKRILGRDLMSTQISHARPEMTLSELATFFEDEDVHGAPVLDDSGRLVGMVSRTDLIRALSELQEDGHEGLSPFYQFLEEEGGWAETAGRLASTAAPDVRVQEIMSQGAVTAEDEASAGELAARMLEEEIHRIVLTRKGAVSGIVSATDLLKAVVEYEKGA